MRSVVIITIIIIIIIIIIYLFILLLLLLLFFFFLRCGNLRSIPLLDDCTVNKWQLHSLQV